MQPCPCTRSCGLWFGWKVSVDTYREPSGSSVADCSTHSTFRAGEFRVEAHTFTLILDATDAEMCMHSIACEQIFSPPPSVSCICARTLRCCWDIAPQFSRPRRTSTAPFSCEECAHSFVGGGASRLALIFTSVCGFAALCQALLSFCTHLQE